MSRLHDSPQPRDVTAMTPIGTSLGNSASPRSDAACGERPSAIRSYTNLERTCLMISSPIPVTETAPRGPAYSPAPTIGERSEEHTSELQSQSNLVCRLLLEKKK